MKFINLEYPEDGQSNQESSVGLKDIRVEFKNNMGTVIGKKLGLELNSTQCKGVRFQTQLCPCVLLNIRSS